MKSFLAVYWSQVNKIYIALDQDAIKQALDSTPPQLASDIIRNGIILTGGGAKSDAWRQIVADICGAPVEMLQQEEGAAFGAALQALAMLEERELTSLVKEHLDRDSTRCCEPDPSTVTFYDEAYFQYRQSVEQIASIYGN